MSRLFYWACCTLIEKQKYILLLLAFSPVAYAEADGPDYWSVRNVEKSDVLNIRRNADYSALKIGEIPYDAQCIKNLGCKGGLSYNEFVTLSEAEKQQILKRRPRWCRVSYRGQVGWVAGRYLQEAPCKTTDENKMPSVLARERCVDPYNHGYAINNEIVILHDGRSQQPIAGSVAVVITEIVSKPLYADVDGDGVEDAVLILMQQTGGSGTFYYLAVALGQVVPGTGLVANSSGSAVIETYFLGDRIKIETLTFKDNLIVVDYLRRADGQPMASMPTIRLNKKFRLAGDKLMQL